MGSGRAMHGLISVNSHRTRSKPFDSSSSDRAALEGRPHLDVKAQDPVGAEPGHEGAQALVVGDDLHRPLVALQRQEVDLEFAWRGLHTRVDFFHALIIAESNRNAIFSEWTKNGKDRPRAMGSCYWIIEIPMAAK